MDYWLSSAKSREELQRLMEFVWAINEMDLRQQAVWEWQCGKLTEIDAIVRSLKQDRQDFKGNLRFVAAVKVRELDTTQHAQEQRLNTT